MAKRASANAGIWLIGGVILLIAMCRGSGDNGPTNTSAAAAAKLSSPVVDPIVPASETMFVTAGSLNQRS